MKNIALFTTSLTIGGVERYVQTLALLLKKLGHNVIIISTNKKTLNFTQVPVVTLSEGVYDSYSWLKPYRLHTILKKYKIDLVIDNRTKLSFLKTFVYSMVLKPSKTIKIIHNYKWDKYLFRAKYLNYYFYEKYKRLICVSEELLQELRLTFDLPNLQRIYAPIPSFDIQPNSLKLPQQFILFFGRLENESKDLSFLVEAYSQSDLIKKNIYLLIMGNGPDELIIKELVNKKGLQNNIHFIKGQSNPFYIIKQSIFTVLTSNYEGFPIAILESLALGVPVVCTKFKSGAEELVKNKENGLCVNKDLESFTNALNTMISDKSLYAVCKSNAINSVNHLKETEIKKQWETLLNTL